MDDMQSNLPKMRVILPGRIIVSKTVYERYGATMLRALNGASKDTEIIVRPDKEAGETWDNGEK